MIRKSMNLLSIPLDRSWLCGELSAPLLRQEATNGLQTTTAHRMTSAGCPSETRGGPMLVKIRWSHAGEKRHPLCLG